MNGGTITGVRVQMATKAEVRYAGFPPAPQIEEEEEERYGYIVGHFYHSSTVLILNP
jgi:hypothetical protein